MEKEKLASFAQLEERYALAKATHSISLFTEGILALSQEQTFTGKRNTQISKDPKYHNYIC